MLPTASHSPRLSTRFGVVGRGLPPLPSSSAGKRRKEEEKKEERDDFLVLRVLSLLGCARCRQRQWFACSAGFTGDDVPRVMFPSGVVRPKMLRIMAGLVQKDSCCGMARLVLLVVLHLALFLLHVASFLGDDLRNGFWKIFTRRSSSWLSPYSAQCLVRHWIHAVCYVAMCVSTAPVAEPTLVSYTVPFFGCTIVATATVVTSCSSGR